MTRHDSWTARSILAAAVFVLLGSHAGAQLIVPVEQDRHVMAFGRATQCSTQFYGESEAAKGFDPFSSMVQGEQTCAGGHSRTLARQDSFINSTSILASGRAESEAAGPDHGIVHAISRSKSDITFQIFSERSFHLAATLSAEGPSPPFVSANARVRLIDGSNNVVFEHIVQPGPNGEFRVEHVHTTGTLTPGFYRFLVEANSAIDAAVPPDGAGGAEFDAAFVLGTAADLVDLNIVLGELVEGTIDDLRQSDDNHVRARSQFGFSATEPNIMDAVVGGAIFGELPSLFHVTIESRLNNPGGSARVRLFDWAAESFVDIGTYPIGLEEEAVTFAEVDATDLVRQKDARFEVSLRHTVIATFSASGFESFIDHVQVLAN